MQRSLFSLQLGSAAELALSDLPAKHFACFIAWDARGVSVDDVSAFVESLLRAGASYFVCWGPDCGRVHDIIDEIASYPGNDFGVPENSCIMTTWHDSETLQEALWFFLVNSWPDEHYADSTRAALAICIDSPASAVEIREALDDPREFTKRAAEDDTG